MLNISEKSPTGLSKQIDPSVDGTKARNLSLKFNNAGVPFDLALKAGAEHVYSLKQKLEPSRSA